MIEKRRLSQPFTHRLFQAALTAACYLMLRPKVVWADKEDKKRLRGRGVVFVCNHTHHFDGVFAASCLHVFKPFTLVSRKWYDKKGMGTLIKLSKAIPIDLEANDASWYVTGEEILREGGAMLIFPEGGIAREGEMLPFKSGAGMLCAKTDAVLVPMAIYGSYKMPFGRRQRLYVGKPIDCRCPENVRYSAYARQLMKDAQSEVEKLYGIPESKYGRLEVYSKSYAEK